MSLLIEGSFLATTAEKVELLCPSCVALKNSEPAIAETTDTNARYALFIIGYFC